MFVQGAPRRAVDLRSADPYERWASIVQDRRTLHALARSAQREMPIIQSGVLRAAFNSLFKLYGGPYHDEMRAIAELAGLPTTLIVLLNCSYELSHAAEHLFGGAPGPFGCTSGVRWLPNRGMVHVRNMDWPLPHLGRATRIYVYTGHGRQFITVGVTGLVGVLSGMVPERYSVTINWAPPTRMPGFDWGPTFLLRQVLESTSSYEQAVRELHDTPLASSVFFTVCGTRNGQACVVERTRTGAYVREFPREGDQSTRVLAQANHFASSRMSWANQMIEEEDDGASVLNYSQERATAIESALRSAYTRKDALDALDEDPVLNGDTYQQMIFCPATGELGCWRWC